VSAQVSRRRLIQLGIGGSIVLAVGGGDARDSVVGFDHRVHGFDNLYVADPSVFPSPPSVDPSLSILAFSFVAADRIHAAL
jgi:choline dehydrogenase-like flavoprotein